MAQTAKSATMLEVGEEGSAFAIPVRLKKIRTKTDVSLDTASPDGNPVGEVKVDIVTEAPVASEDCRKGVFKSKLVKSDKTTWSDFAEIAKDDLDEIAEATRLDTLVVEHFIPLADVPFERVMDAYFLAPASGTGTKALTLLAKALKKRKAAGVFKMVKTSRQYLAVVYESGGGLIVNTLAFSHDFASVREAAEVLEAQDAAVSRPMVEMACELIDRWAASADVLDSYEDELVVAKAMLIEKALAGEELPKRKVRKASPVATDGLEARLRETLEMVQAAR